MSIYRMMPYADVTEDIIILKDGSMSVIYEIRSTTGYDTLTLAERGRLSTEIDAMLSNFYPYVSVQIINDYYVTRYEPDKKLQETEILQVLHDSRDKKYSEREFNEHEIYLSLNFNPGAKKAKTSPLKHIAMAAKKEVADIQDIKHQIASLFTITESFLSANNIAFKQLNTEELKKLLARYINSMPKSVIDGMEFRMSGYAANYELCMKEYVVSKQEFQIGDEFIGVISLTLLPEWSQPYNRHEQNYVVPLLHPVLNGITFPHRTVVTIKTTNKNQEINALKNDAKINKSFAGKDEKAQKKIQEVHEVIDEAVKMHKDLTYCGVKILISDLDKKELKHKTDKVLLSLNKVIGAVGYYEKIDAMPLFLSCLPGAQASDYRTFLMKSENAADFVSIHKYYQGDI